MRNYRFCPFCGQALAERESGGRRRPACRCGFVDYGNPAPAAGVAVLRDDHCLWVRRAEEPFRGAWSLPSGFQEWEEDIRHCALREAREETGLKLKLGSILGAYSSFDDPRHNSLLVVFLAEPLGGEERAGDDADQLGWFPLESPPAPIAWESHRQVLIDLRARRDREESGR